MTKKHTRTMLILKTPIAAMYEVECDESDTEEEVCEKALAIAQAGPSDPDGALLHWQPWEAGYFVIPMEQEVRPCKS